MHKYNIHWKIRDDLLEVFKKLDVIPTSPLSDLMKALEAGSQSAVQNFGNPTKMYISVEYLESMRKIVTFDKDNLKP